MTPERLQELILEGQPGEIAAALAPLPEKERKKISRAASSLYRQLQRGELAKDAPPPLRALFERIKGSLSRAEPISPYNNGQLAILGVCPLSVTRKLDIWYVRDEYEAALLKVLGDRRPDWIDEWLEFRLDEEFHGLSWRLVRQLIRDGVCARPRCDGYIRLLAQGLNVVWQRPGEEPPPPLSQLLLADPELLENEIWRLFEVETTAFTFDWGENHPHRPEGYESWSTALIRLAREGAIDRQRLLDATLSGLSTGFKQNQLAGYHRLHTRLEPTGSEIRRRESVYRDLLGAKTGHVVQFALKMLGTLDRAGELDGRAFLEAAPPVFLLSTKGPSSKVLRLTKRLVGRSPELAEPAAALAAGGLTHPSPDIQGAALEMLESLAASGEVDVLDAIRTAREHLAPSLQARARKLIEEMEHGTEPGAGPGETPGTGAGLDDLRTRARAIDRSIRQRTGLADDVLNGAPAGLPPALEFDLLDAPVLSSLEPVVPISDLDELIDAVSRAVEVVDSAGEVERILDGLSRLCDRRPDHFESRTAALLKRIREPRSSDVIRGMVSSWGGTPLALLDLLLTWLTGSLHETPRRDHVTDAAPFLILMQRIRELARRVHLRQAAPLLAAPTHEGGWIDPLALVHRLRDLGERGQFAPRADFVQGLLRLAPDGRSVAGEEARSLEGVTGRVVRWALGMDGGPRAEDREDHELWIAAARARAPRRSWREEFSVLRLEDDLPDSLDPAVYSWHASVTRSEIQGREYACPALTITVSTSPEGGKKRRVSTTRRESEDAVARPGLAARARALVSAVKRIGSGTVKTDWKGIPTAALHRFTVPSWQTPDLHGAWLIRWLGTIWPLNTDSTLVIGVRALMDRYDQNAATTAPNFAFLEPAFAVDRPWSEKAVLALWVALVGKDADARGLAVDALIEGIEDGRADVARMSPVLLHLSRGGWLKANRLAESLGRVSPVSDLHGSFVAGLLDRYLAGVESLPRNSHHLLELLLNLLSHLGTTLESDALERLATMRGGGKAARLARQIRELEKDDSKSPTVLASALTGRLERAERWQDALRLPTAT